MWRFVQICSLSGPVNVGPSAASAALAAEVSFMGKEELEKGNKCARHA